MKKIEIKQWSFFGRFRELVFKLISLKGVVLIVVLWAWISGRIDDTYAVLGFVSVMLGIRAYEKKIGGVFGKLAEKIAK